MKINKMGLKHVPKGNQMIQMIWYDGREWKGVGQLDQLFLSIECKIIREKNLKIAESLRSDMIKLFDFCTATQNGFNLTNQD